MRWQHVVRNVSLRNKELTVVVPEILPPFVNYLNYSRAYESDIGYGPGILWQIFRQLGEAMNLTYRIAPIDMDSSMRWDLAFDKMKEVDADIMVGGAVMQHHSQQWPNFTWSMPFQFEQTGILYHVDSSHLFNRQKISYGPFTLKVWVMAILCLFLSSMILRFSSTFIFHQHSDKSLLNHCLMFFSALCRHSINYNGCTLSSRFLIMTWYFGSLVLFIMYCVGSTFMPNYESAVPFKTFSSVIDAFEHSDDYRLVLNDRSGRTEMFKKSVLKDVRRFWNYVNYNEMVIYTQRTEDAIEMVRHEPHYMFMGPLDTLKLVAARDCRLNVAPQGILPAFIGIALRKNSPYTDLINKIIFDFTEHGFIDKWTRGYGVYMSTNFSAVCDYKEGKNFVDLRMSLLRGPFILCGIGLLISALLMTLELLYAKYLAPRIRRILQTK